MKKTFVRVSVIAATLLLTSYAYTQQQPVATAKYAKEVSYQRSNLFGCTSNYEYSDSDCDYTEELVEL